MYIVEIQYTKDYSNQAIVYGKVLLNSPDGWVSNNNPSPEIIIMSNINKQVSSQG